MEPFLQNQWLWMIVLIPLALILSYFMYAKRDFPSTWTKPVLVLLRAIGLTLLFLLMINPKITQKTVSIEHPELNILLDQSKSIDDSLAISAIYQQWQNDAALNDKFNVNWYGFGLGLAALNELNFQETETNIGTAVANLDGLLGQSDGPLIVVTDGQQTIGPSYMSYTSENRPIYPVIVGDTIWPEDLSIHRVTANPIVLKGQSFEIELVLDRLGSTQETRTMLQVFQNGQMLKSTRVIFSEGLSRQVIQTELRTDDPGPQTFTWALKPLVGEQIIENNTATLDVESIDEQRRILLVYNHAHPDIGVLARGLRADDRTRIITAKPKNAERLLQDIDAVILYEPTSTFSGLISKINQEQINTWIVSGPQTQWNVITKIQPTINKESYRVADALFSRPNAEFSLFKSSFNQWSQMPPLVSDIGQINIDTPHEVLLYSVLQGQLNGPQISFFERKNVRWIIWDGIDFWRWRMQAYRLTQSHESFDEFLGTLAKYIAKKQKRNTLELNYKSVYTQINQAELYAQYLDKTDALNLNADLEIQMIHRDTKQEIVRPLLADSRQYKLQLYDLNPGVYDFTVKVLGTTEQKSGRFEIAPSDSETGAGYAKIKAMQTWADLNGVPLRNLSQMDDLKVELLNDKEFAPKEVVSVKKLDFIRWYYALALLILISTAEWFIRKYYGLT